MLVLTRSYPPPIFLQKAWNTLEKYQHLFNPDKFLFIKRNFNEIGEDLFLINKVAFKNTVNEHIRLFQEIIGNHVTAEYLLSQIEKAHSNLHEVLHHNQTLIGILLGFGKHNSYIPRPTAKFS